MGIIRNLFRLIAKLDKSESPYVITDEVLELSNGKWEGYIGHDNVIPETIEVYTAAKKSGKQILNYTTTKSEPWKLYMNVYASGYEKLYLSYETYGDTVEAEDINQLQNAVDYVGEQIKNHEASESNPHKVTKIQVGLGNVDNVQQATKEEFTEHKEDTDNPHGVNKIQVGLSNVDNVQQASKTDFQNHVQNVSNPHSVTKNQVGLGNVENVQQATKLEFNAHNNDENRHVTTSEKSNWNDKYSRNEIDNKFSALETNIDWKEAVDTYDDIATTYPNPQDGWTVNVKDTDYTYRYSGSEWVAISANSIPVATQETNGLLSAGDKANYDDANSKKHTHSNKSVLDLITSSLISNLNAAFTHISDTAKHITATERTNWNTAHTKSHEHSNKSILDTYSQTEVNLADAVSKKHSHSNKSVIDKITQALLDKLGTIEEGANKYIHPTTSGNKHIPSGGSSGQILRWSGDGSGVWGNENNSTYTDMTAATETTDGTHGLVPAPSAGEQVKYLRGDGTWQAPSNTTYGVVSTSANGLCPKRGGTTTKFLRDDGTWAVPPDTNTVYSHPNSGVAAGEYLKVSVNAQGHVTAGNKSLTWGDLKGGET